tara:strand:+ start:105 stop:392 length:288 start_codon:yes stop_codon:yes gene_type:complete
MKNVKNAHMGNHLLTEVYNVPFDKLNNSKKIGQVCESACKTEGLEVLNTYVHQFDPYGVTCTVTLVKVTFLVILGLRKGVLQSIFSLVERKIHVQ